MLSRRDGGRPGGVKPTSASSLSSKTTFRSFIGVSRFGVSRLGVAARGAEVPARSRGIASGVPVPRAMGDTLNDSRAWTVQASMSTVTVEAVEGCIWWWGVNGAGGTWTATDSSATDSSSGCGTGADTVIAIDSVVARIVSR